MSCQPLLRWSLIPCRIFGAAEIGIRKVPKLAYLHHKLIGLPLHCRLSLVTRWFGIFPTDFFRLIGQQRLNSKRVPEHAHLHRRPIGLPLRYPFAAVKPGWFRVRLTNSSGSLFTSLLPYYYLRHSCSPFVIPLMSLILHSCSPSIIPL